MEIGHLQSTAKDMDWIFSPNFFSSFISHDLKFSLSLNSHHAIARDTAWEVSDPLFDGSFLSEIFLTPFQQGCAMHANQGKTGGSSTCAQSVYKI